jgi:hypothetical protein
LKHKEFQGEAQELYEPKKKKVLPTKAERILMKSFHSNANKSSFGPESEKPSRLTNKEPKSLESNGTIMKQEKTISKESFYE